MFKIAKPNSILKLIALATPVNIPSDSECDPATCISIAMKMASNCNLIVSYVQTQDEIISGPRTEIRDTLLGARKRAMILRQKCDKVTLKNINKQFKPLCNLYDGLRGSIEHACILMPSERDLIVRLEQAL